MTQDVLVKFVWRYGKDVTRNWIASKGLALPVHVHYGHLALVVMECVEGQSLCELYGRDIPEYAHRAVWTILDGLVEGGSWLRAEYHAYERQTDKNVYDSSILTGRARRDGARYGSLRLRIPKRPEAYNQAMVSSSNRLMSKLLIS